MSVNNLYILPESVRITPVVELAEQTRSKFEYDENDFVLTYPNSRSGSKVIDSGAASMLKEFRSPKSFVEGVFKYSFMNKLNPSEILEESFPLLKQLRNEGFLIPFHEDAPASNNNSLKPGDSFKEYEVVAKVQDMTDTEVFRIQQGDRFFALKMLKSHGNSSYTSENFNNELEILHHLDGKINPSIIESGEYNTQQYIVMEWCEGSTCDDEAEKYRNLSNPDNLEKLLNISCSILQAYDYLHRQDVVHSDIHPGNIIIGENGEVKIIDFGLARIGSSSKCISRGGIGFFFEPEYAETIINQQTQPASSFQGEQYALGALIYLLLTGKHYINFSFEKEHLFNQILIEPQLPFSSYDIHIDPDIEIVISKALSKKATDRFTSLSEFAEELQRVKNKAALQIPTLLLESKYSFSAFCDGLKRKYGFDGKLIEKGLQLSPSSSVNYGAAGVAYLFYRMASIEADPELIALADVWINRASNYSDNKENAFYSSEIGITPATVGTSSIYHTGSGVQLIQALISKSMGDYRTYHRSVLDFIGEASQPCDNLDLTLGKSGTLIGCSILHKSNLDKKSNLMNELKNLGDHTLSEIWDKTDTYAPIHESNPIDYMGIAHGWAGILYATLKWCDVSKKTLPPDFFNRVEQLIDLGIEEDEMLRWNLTSTDMASWPGWCHGTAGYTFLFTSLFHFTKDSRYMTIAEKAVRHFLSADRDGINGNLCCGMAGEAYALLNIFRATENGFYLREAKRLSKRILGCAYSPLMRNNSLYKGDVGIGTLFSELAMPQYALMPLFE